jgi:hypothetical protein
MTAHQESDALHARARARIRAYEEGRAPAESFDALAIDLARFQARHVQGYARLCAARGVDVARISTAAEAPAVPTDAFKLAHVFAFDAGAAARTFRTSGTTVGARGVHPLRVASTYDAAALAFGRVMLGRGLDTPPVLVIGPSTAEAPDSSLAHMCALFARSLGLPQSDDATFFIRRGELDVAALRRRVGALGRSSPALLLATSFALVHLLDAVGDSVLALPPGSRVMQTGGFKGRSREVAPGELRAAAARLFAVTERDVVGEYGMTELSSQFWEATAVDAAASAGTYREPPWARVVPVDPVSLERVAEGEVGIGRIEDLANVDSAFAVVTQDRVRRVAGGFELLGRTSGAPARGCSIAVDEMLAPGGTGGMEP